MVPRLTVPDEGPCLRQEVLLGDPEALPQGGRRALVHEPHRSARGVADVDPVEAGADITGALGHRPDLPGGQWVEADRVGALELGGRDELLDAVADPVAELSRAELRRADAPLLLLDPPAHLERQAHGPLQLLVGHGRLRIRVQQLEQAVDGLVHRREVATGQRVGVVHPALHGRQARLRAQPAPALRDEVAHQPEVLGEVGGVELGHVPARDVRVQPVHERGVVPHLRGQGREQVTDPLLVRDVDVEVPDEHDRAIGPDGLPAAGELTRLHVALHDVDAVLLVEGDARDLVEADDVVLRDQAALAGGVVDEHPRDGRLAAGDEVRVRGHLLEQVGLAGAARAQLDQVVVAHHERDHPQQQDVLLAGREPRGLEPDGPQEQVLPLLGGERRTPSGQVLQGVAGGQLDGSQRSDAERTAARLLGNDGVVVQVDLGVEPAGEHPLVRPDDLVGDPHVPQLEAGQLGEVAVGLGVEARLDEVDELDRRPLTGARLEELLLAGPDGAVGQEPADHCQALLDLLGVGGRAVPAEQELPDVGRDGVGALEPVGEVLLHHVAVEHLGGQPVDLVQGERVHGFSPTLVRRCARTAPASSSTTTWISAPACASSSTNALASPSTTGRAAAMALDGSAGANRSSTVSPDLGGATSTRHRRPVHFSASTRTSTALAPPAVTVTTGVMHSCGLRPPCS